MTFSPALYHHHIDYNAIVRSNGKRQVSQLLVTHVRGLRFRLQTRPPRYHNLGRLNANSLSLADNKHRDAQNAQQSERNNSIRSPILRIWPPPSARRPYFLGIGEARTSSHTSPRSGYRAIRKADSLQPLRLCLSGERLTREDCFAAATIGCAMPYILEQIAQDVGDGAG
jgi:hypothetical protein